MSTPDVKAIRTALGLTQAEFAERYDIGLPRLRDWEQGRYEMDSVARAYLAVIAQHPVMVAKAVRS